MADTRDWLSKLGNIEPYQFENRCYCPGASLGVLFWVNPLCPVHNAAIRGGYGAQAPDPPKEEPSWEQKPVAGKPSETGS